MSLYREVKKLIKDWAKPDIVPTGDAQYDLGREHSYQACAEELQEAVADSEWSLKDATLIKRIDVRNLDPNLCCFIFGFGDEQPIFRVYSEDKTTFKDYYVRTGVTPFVKLVDDDVELKEYLSSKDDKDEVLRVMDFPEYALTAGRAKLLRPGEVWVKDDTKTD